MAEAVILSVVQKLETRRVESPITFLLVNDDVNEVINELRMLVEFLRDEKLEEGSRLHYLIDDVIEMALDLNQLEDNFALCLVINSIKTWIREVKMRILRFGTDEANSRLENDAEGHDENVDVGLEEDMESLLHEVVFHADQGLCTSLFTGMVGMGKTTLARKLYNHQSVLDGFELRAWVRVSGDLSHKEILMKLIQQVVNCNELERVWLMGFMKNMDNGRLQQALHQNLQGIRYFIVLDDFPKEMCLRSITKGLPHEDKRSRLLVTSRTKNLVWVHMNASTFHSFHEMKPLDSDQSWKLFLRTIFSGNDKFTSEQKFPKQLEKRGREMLKRCSGVPLAIKEVGMQLAEKRQCGIEWEDLFESVDFSSMLELMEVSYHRLDPEAKLCFLHLACFKENITLREEKLVQIWAAEGMISEKEHERSTYLGKLIVECIIEIKDRTSFYGMKSCSINSLQHMLSIKKAEEEIGFEILRNDGNDRPSQSPRHRVIVSSRDEFSYSTNQDKHLVSLFFHGGGYFDSSPSYWKSFEQLRILDFEDFGLKILPETIGTLIELRYLGLRNNHLQELPRPLWHLGKLEVLDIAQNFMVEVPDIIWEMENLHHLDMSDIICRKPLKINSLKNLDTLTFISIDDWIHEVSGLEAMSSLRKLGIEGLDGNMNVSKLFASLSKLSSLLILILRGFRFRSMPCLDELRVLHSLYSLKLEGLLAKLPCADDFPPNIAYLKLVNSSLEEDPMPVLGKLPKLTQLKLQNAFVGREMVISGDGFLELKVLHVEEFRNLRNVGVEEGAMQVLEQLEIKNCPYLEAVPEEMRSMACLEKLKMVTTKNIAKKIRNSSSISKIMDVEIN